MQNNHCMQEIYLKITYFDSGLSETFKKVYFFFQTQSLLMDKVFKNERDLELVTSRSFVYETSSQIYYFIYYLPKFDGNYTCKFM